LVIRPIIDLFQIDVHFFFHMRFSRRLCYVVVACIRAVIRVVNGYRLMNGQIEWRSVIRRFEDLLSGTGGFPGRT
jgi:hypothetical protein